MTEHFLPGAPSIRFTALVKGPARTGAFRALLDTGASRSVLAWETASGCGYDPGTSERQVQIYTASGVEICPEIVLSEITFLGRRMRDFPVLCHPLPGEMGIDAVIGLDFFVGTKLTIDFRSGTVNLEL